MHFKAVPSGNMTPEREGASVSLLSRQTGRHAHTEHNIISPVPSENYTQAGTQY